MSTQLKRKGEDIYLNYSNVNNREPEIRYYLKTHRNIERTKEFIHQYRYCDAFLSEGKTTELLDMFYLGREKYQYLVLRDVFVVKSKSDKRYRISLCFSKGKSNFTLSNIKYTLSELKTLNVTLEEAPKLTPKPFLDLQAVIALTLFGRNLSLYSKGELIPLHRAIEVTAQTSKDHDQVWKDKKEDSFRWNARKLYITHMMIERDFSDEEKRKILKWNWRNEYIEVKQQLLILKKNFHYDNQPIIHHIYGNGKILSVDEAKDRATVQFFNKVLKISLSKSLEHNIIRFTSSKMADDYEKINEFSKRMIAIKQKAIRLNNAKETAEIDKLIPTRVKWEEMLRNYEKNVPVSNVKMSSAEINLNGDSEFVHPHLSNDVAIEETVKKILVDKVRQSKKGEKFSSLIEKDFLRVDNHNYELYKQTIKNYQEQYHDYATFSGKLSNRDMDSILKRILTHLQVNESEEKELLKRVGSHRSLGLERYGKKLSEAVFRRELEFTIGMMLLEIEKNSAAKDKEDDVKTNKW